MRKLILLALLASSVAFSATSGSITISGSVPKATSIAISPTAVSSALDLMTTQNDLVIASVSEKSNSKDGYKVTLASTNGGYLINTTSASDKIQYTMKYNGTAVSLSSTATVTDTTTGPTNATKSMTISYTGVDQYATLNGTYSDTLTLTISVK